MKTMFFIATLVAMAAVLIVLVAGLFMMAKGGELNKKYGNKLMRARVYLQGIAILFFLLTMVSE